MAELWCNSHDEIVAFGRILVSNYDWTMAEFFRYLEKPWKWSPEHAVWVKAGKPGEVSDELNQLLDEASEQNPVT